MICQGFLAFSCIFIRAQRASPSSAEFIFSPPNTQGCLRTIFFADPTYHIIYRKQPFFLCRSGCLTSPERAHPPVLHTDFPCPHCPLPEPLPLPLPSYIFAGFQKSVPDPMDSRLLPRSFAVISTRSLNVYMIQYPFPYSNASGYFTIFCLSSPGLHPLNNLQPGKFFPFLLFQGIGNGPGQLFIMRNRDVL